MIYPTAVRDGPLYRNSVLRRTGFFETILEVVGSQCLLDINGSDKKLDMKQSI
jgi:hypothetical protein